jgi:hypothetical protein
MSLSKKARVDFDKVCTSVLDVIGRLLNYSDNSVKPREWQFVFQVTAGRGGGKKTDGKNFVLEAAS